LYRLCRIILRFILRVLFRLEVTGLENLPRKGPALIAANHVSFWDPPVIGVNIPRYIHFMAKDELFKIPVLGWIIKKFQAFPVRRGMADRTAIRTAVGLLESGEIIGLFPEGTRSKTGVLGRPEAGVAMIALKTGAPIIPTAVIGTRATFSAKNRFPRFKVKFGNPICFNSQKYNKDSIEQLSDIMMREIERLLKEE
jgi:1-acyl-sn-glycerol-3-phosphate acyltransferase